MRSPAPPRHDFRFVNWSGNARCHPHSYYQPATEDELVWLVRRAREAGEILRVVGAGHSWNDSACSPHFLVNLDRYGDVLDVDLARHRVTMQAGRRLGDIAHFLDRQGLHFANLGSVTEQSIAGAISTGTHGTGLRLGNLATQVVALRLVTGTGEVLELSDSQEPELFRAARVSLGSLGVISTVTLQCVPAYQVEERSWTLTFDQAVDQVVELAERHERVKLWWLPHTGLVQVFTYDRTDRPPPERPPLARRLESSPVLQHLFAGLLQVGRAQPALIPTINRLVSRGYFRDVRRTDTGHRLLPVPMPPRHQETEFAIPYREAPQALRRMHEIIASDGLRVNFVQEVRFVAGDDSPLSPAFGRDTCQIGAYMARSADLAPYFRRFERMMLERGARPHWGKAFGAGRSTLSAAFPQFERFDALRRQLDPGGIFVNSYLRRVFGA